MRPGVIAVALLILPACASQRVTLTPDQARQVNGREVELEVVDSHAAAASNEPRRLKLDVDRIGVSYEGQKGSRSYVPSELIRADGHIWYEQGLEPSSVELVEKDVCAARAIPAVLAGLAGGALMTWYWSTLPPNDGLEGLALLTGAPTAAAGLAAISLFISVPLTSDTCSSRSRAVRVIDPSAPAQSPAPTANEAGATSAPAAAAAL
jgi:hypothetical protein